MYFFWNAIDLARKLHDFRDYYNYWRVHRGLNGNTPIQEAGTPVSAGPGLALPSWRQHCRSLFQTPIAA